MVRACPVCGSRRWRRDNVTGSAVCEDGHVYQDFRVENQDADGPSQHALQRRKMKARRGLPKKAQGSKNEAVYEGEDAEYLRLQALQLLLRTQVMAIRKLWDLPDVYEMIVRDLWTYQLAISALPPPPEDPTARADSSTSLPLQPSVLPSQGLIGRLEADGKSDTDSEASDDTASDKSDRDEDHEVDPDLLEEMSQLSELSDKEKGSRTGGEGDVRKRQERNRRRVKVSDTLVVLCLGLWVVRRGTMFVDIENLVNRNVIPYLDFAHSTLLPCDMQSHMNRNVVQSLSPIRCPSPKYLFSSIRIFARILNTEYGLPIPDVNLPPISWRVIGALGGTPVIHSQVTRLMDLVDINTSLLETSITVHKRRARGSGRASRRNSTRGPSRTQSRGRSTGGPLGDSDGSEADVGAEVAMALYRRTNRNRDVVMPELAVVAAWVVVMKMAYGLDGCDRRAGDAHDPVAGLPEAKVWTGELERRLKAGSLNPQRRYLGKHDFASVPMDNIDRYLNFAEEVLLKSREAPPGSDTIAFPYIAAPTIPPLLSPATSYRHLHTALPITPSDPSPTTLGSALPPEPGEEIRSYDPKDTTGSLPRAYEAVIRSAAEVIGVKIGDVAEAVQLIERRLEKVRKERRISFRGKYGNGRAKDRSKSRGRATVDVPGSGDEFEVDGFSEGSEIEED